MDFSELKELIRILELSGLSELEVEENGRRIRLHKAGAAPAPVSAHAVPVIVDSSPAPHHSKAHGLAAVPEEDPAGGLPTLDSPMVGTFYRSPSPESDAFVKVGDRVEVNQTICIIEAMKLMNEVGAKFAGVIEKILVENAQAVEFGQPLFAVRRVD